MSAQASAPSPFRLETLRPGAKGRILSGMRPTGRLHLGNWVGALQNWVKLQDEYENFHMVADWHALTTGVDQVEEIQANTYEMVLDWLAAGIDPARSPVFVQSHVKEHAELHLLFSMLVSKARLERNPTLKDQVRDLGMEEASISYGHLGYACLQAADILLYRADSVPVGEDQVPHVEITREIARRFNHLYGQEPDFELRAERAVKELGGRNITLYRQLRKQFQEKGDAGALERARNLVSGNTRITVADRERLLGYLEGTSVSILPEPGVLLTATPRVPGLDGRKMSKSYGNTIGLREEPDSVVRKLKAMQTDPARVRRTDPGNPEICPVFDLHRIYSDEATRGWASAGCRSAGIGCLECKQPLIEKVVAEVTGMRERARDYQDNPDLVKNLLAQGAEKARETARHTLDDVRRAMHLRAE